MRLLLFLFTVIGMTACFDDGTNAKTVKIVDTRKDGTSGSTTTQTVSDADFKALQDTVTALKVEGQALKTEWQALKAELTTLKSSTNTELTALGASVNGLSATSLKAQWLYDGNHVKRHKVVSVFEREGWQQAIVEISTGVNARYSLNRFSDANPQQAPEKLDPSPPAGSTNIYYTLANCTGTPILDDVWTGKDFGQAGAIGNYFVWVTSATQRFNGYTHNSGTAGVTCTNGTSTVAGRASAAVVQPVSNYIYPNPLTVGP